MIFCWPTGAPYKQRDQAPHDSIKTGEWWRVNWLGHHYLLLGQEAVHEGDDLVRLGVNCLGDPVYAIANGVVLFAETVFLKDGRPSSWGRLVVIQHRVDGAHLYSRYAHLSKILVAEGQIVSAGQQIGAVGDTDGMLPPHLHFSICDTERNLVRPTDWPNNLAIIEANYVDPLAYLRSHMVENPDTLKALRESLAGKPDGFPVLVIPGIPPQLPTEIVTAYQVTVGDFKSPLVPMPAPVPTPSPAPEARHVIINATLGLRVRQSPVDGAILGKLPNGDSEMVIPAVVDGATVTGWWQISGGQWDKGFVSGQYLIFPQ